MENTIIIITVERFTLSDGVFLPCDYGPDSYVGVLENPMKINNSPQNYEFRTNNYYSISCFPG